jgi:predicted PurR-regulated permease PerM
MTKKRKRLIAIIPAIIVVALSVYWNMSRIYTERLWLSLLPLEKRAAARDIWHAIENEVGAYIRSELVQSIIAGFILGFGYWLIGFRYPTMLAVIAAVCWLVPWVGVLMIVAAVVVLALPTFALEGQAAGMLTGGLTLLLTLGVFIVMEVVVEPRFFNRRRYNSLLTVLAVILLADTWGIFGLLLGPLLAVAIQVLGEQLLRARAAAASAATTAPGAGIGERMASLRALLAAREEPPPELLSLVNRLEALVEEAAETVSGWQGPHGSAGTAPAPIPALR